MILEPSGAADWPVGTQASSSGFGAADRRGPLAQESGGNGPFFKVAAHAMTLSVLAVLAGCVMRDLPQADRAETADPPPLQAPRLPK